MISACVGGFVVGLRVSAGLFICMLKKKALSLYAVMSVHKMMMMMDEQLVYKFANVSFIVSFKKAPFL